MNLYWFFLSFEPNGLSAAQSHSEACSDRASVAEPGRWKRLKEISECAIQLRAQIGISILNLVKLPLKGDSRLCKEAETSVLLAEGDQTVLQQFMHHLRDIFGQRWRGDARLEQSSYIMRGDGQVFKNLQNGNGLGNIQVQLLTGMTVCHALNPIDEVAVTALNVPAKRVIKGYSVGQSTHLGIREQQVSGRAPTAIHEHVLQDFDRRSKSQSPGFSRQPPQ